jgi:hypothetical protein
MKEPKEKTIPAVFYRTTAGMEPVREWLMELDPEDRRIIGTDIRTIEFGWPIWNAGMPTHGQRPI